jgi:hypothetical protein
MEVNSGKTRKLTYSIHACSRYLLTLYITYYIIIMSKKTFIIVFILMPFFSFSSSYLPQNIMEDKPKDQASR